MSDRTSGPGGERPTGRFTQPPDEDRSPEGAVPEGGTPREPRSEERLPGEPPPSRLPGSAGPGREGLTADDRTPDDMPAYPPGPAGTAGAGSGSRYDTATGTEGLRPGTEDLASDTGETGAPGAGRRTGGGGMTGEDGMPDDGLGVPFSGETGAREARSTETPAPDTWPAAPGGPRGSAGAAAPGSVAPAGTAVPAGAPSPAGGSGVGEQTASPSGAGAPLLPHDETDRWEQRIRELTAGFVDEPRRAVQEADRALEELVARFDEAVARRRRTLRRSWEASEDRGPGTETDTEQLRLALRDYRELAGRLLHL